MAGSRLELNHGAIQADRITIDANGALVGPGTVQIEDRLLLSSTGQLVLDLTETEGNDPPPLAVEGIVQNIHTEGSEHTVLTREPGVRRIHVRVETVVEREALLGFAAGKKRRE